MLAAKTIIAVAFVWSLLKGLELLLRRYSVDRLLLEHVGLGWLWQCILYGMEICQVAGLLWIWRPYPYGMHFALAAVGLNLATTLLVTGVGFRHPETLRRAMVASREERSMPVREAALRLVELPLVRALQIALPLLFSSLWIGLILYVARGN